MEARFTLQVSGCVHTNDTSTRNLAVCLTTDPSSNVVKLRCNYRVCRPEYVVAAFFPIDMGTKRLDPDVPTENGRRKFSRMSEEEKSARRRYLMFIEYNGNDFSGSQRQRDGVRTVQEACETALAEMTKEV